MDYSQQNSMLMIDRPSAPFYGSCSQAMSATAEQNVPNLPHISGHQIVSTQNENGISSSSGDRSEYVSSALVNNTSPVRPTSYYYSAPSNHYNYGKLGALPATVTLTQVYLRQYK